MLGLKPHILTRMHPRRRKCLERLHSGWSCGEMFEGTSLRGLSSSDLTNVGQVSFCLTWVIFQEIPVTKIDFRCVKKGQEHGNILGKGCYHCIKCTTAAFLTALMWRRSLNSVFNYYHLQKTRKDVQYDRYLSAGLDSK